MKRPEERSRLLLGLIAAVLAVGLVSCSAKTASETDSKTGAAGGSAAVKVSPAAVAALAKADEADGASDKVVSKCLMCALAMDGSADIASKVGDYTLHLCSDKCKEAVDADPEKALASMK